MYLATDRYVFRRAVRIMPMVLCLVAGIASGVKAQDSASCGGPFRVGYRVVEVAEGVETAIWYPTAAEESRHFYTLILSGQVAQDGPPLACGQFPVVLFSHGFGGCGVQSAFVTEELARRGYIVAGPDHDDSTCSVSNPLLWQSVDFDAIQRQPAGWTEEAFADRRDDMTAVLEWLLGDEEFGPLIDNDAIGAIGHSLGGYTVLGLAGAWPSWRDTRIRAVLAYSPYVETFLVEDRIAGVETPVMYQGAPRDFLTPLVTQENGAFPLSRAPKYYVELPRGNHFSWSTAVCLGSSTVDACLERMDLARIINEYSFAFLDRYLKGEQQPLLTQDAPELGDYRRVTRFFTASAASLDFSQPVSPESIVSGFGESVAAGIVVASALPLPTVLGNVEVRLTDSAGVERPAPLLFASPGQINFLVPPEAALGDAIVRVWAGGELIAEGAVNVTAVSPSLFAADATGKGVAAGRYVRVRSDGVRESGLLYTPETKAAVPVSLGAGGDRVFLELFGTGIRGASGGVSAMIGGVEVPVSAFGDQGEFEGVDQVNLGPLPGELSARGGMLDVVLKIADTVANTVTVWIQE